MPLPKIFRRTVLIHQRPPIECARTPQNVHFQRLLSTGEQSQPEEESFPNRKLIKVAIVGRPNVGKSTLINTMMNLHLCGVSHKSHTTETCFRAAFTKGDTQIVFIDTPGLVTEKELQKFNLSEYFLGWKKKVLNDVDVIGVVHSILGPRDVYNFHLNLVQNINSFPETTPVFLVASKMDVIIDREAVSRAFQKVMRHQDSNEPNKKNERNIWRKFSRVFFTSAAKNEGVDEVVEYLVEQAKPGKWIFEPGEVHRKPLHVLIKDLLRAKLMNVLPNEIPYSCKYEVEYLKENHLGEVICVVLVTCSRPRHIKFIVNLKTSSLGAITKKLESDLYNIVHKVFKIKVEVVADEKLRMKGHGEKRNEPARDIPSLGI